MECLFIKKKVRETKGGFFETRFNLFFRVYVYLCTQKSTL